MKKVRNISTSGSGRECNARLPGLEERDQASDQAERRYGLGPDEQRGGRLRQPVRLRRLLEHPSAAQRVWGSVRAVQGEAALQEHQPDEARLCRRGRRLDRQTYRQTDRKTDKHTDIKTWMYLKLWKVDFRQRQTNSMAERENVGKMDRRTVRQIDDVNINRY